MPPPQFKIGIKNNTTAQADGSVLDLYFLDLIQNPEYYDWQSEQMEEGSLVAEIINQVNYYNPSKIVCHIDSMGGDLNIACSLYNFLKSSPAKVETRIMGFCASAATILACAANKGKRYMSKNGWHITHQGTMWDISGQVKDILKAADLLDKRNRQMAEILADNNTESHTADEILALWTDGDCWMSGTTAEQYGFVDACYNAETVMITARVEEAARMFKNAPKNLVTAEVIPDNNDSILSKIENTMKSFTEMVTAALGKIKGNKITAKVEGSESVVDVTDVVTASLQPVMVELAANMQTEVTAEIAEQVKTITASFEEKYGQVITGLTKENKELKTSLQTLTEDVTAMAGKESRPGAKTTSDTGKKGAKTFADTIA